MTAILLKILQKDGNKLFRLQSNLSEKEWIQYDAAILILILHVYCRVHSIYTHFRNKMEKNCQVRPEIDTPKTLPPLPDGIEEGDIPSVTDFNLTG